MRRIMLLVTAFAVAVPLFSGVAAAAPNNSPGAVEVIGDDQANAPAATVDGVGVQYVNNVCTVLTSPGGAWAEACKTYHLESDGSGWFGTFSARIAGATFVQAEVLAENGVPTVVHLGRPDGAGVFFHASRILLRACNSFSGDCGAWW